MTPYKFHNLAPRYSAYEHFKYQDRLKYQFSSLEFIFERQPSLRLAFDGDLTPDVVLTNLEIGLGQSIDRQTSLLFLDEIQDCPRALTAHGVISAITLKYPPYFGIWSFLRYRTADFSISHPILNFTDSYCFRRTRFDDVRGDDHPFVFADQGLAWTKVAARYGHRLPADVATRMTP